MNIFTYCPESYFILLEVAINLVFFGDISKTASKWQTEKPPSKA